MLTSVDPVCSQQQIYAGLNVRHVNWALMAAVFMPSAASKVNDETATSSITSGNDIHEPNSPGPEHEHLQRLTETEG